VTIAEAATLTGLTKGALASRIERGTLPVEKRGSRRRIPLAALYEARLISMSPGRTIDELLDRLERQAQRIGELEAEVERLRGP
jgi:excisionase family DNA binding protein